MFHSKSEIPYDKIEKVKTIGISSGASAPELLIKNFIKNLKSKFKISVEEIEIVKEKVVFKVPNNLN